MDLGSCCIYDMCTISITKVCTFNVICDMNYMEIDFAAPIPYTRSWGLYKKKMDSFFLLTLYAYRFEPNASVFTSVSSLFLVLYQFWHQFPCTFTVVFLLQGSLKTNLRVTKYVFMKKLIRNFRLIFHF